MEVMDEMTEEQCDAMMKDAEEKREVAKMQLETRKTLIAEKREKEIKMRAFLDNLLKVNRETESYLAELAEYEKGSLPVAESNKPDVEFDFCKGSLHHSVPLANPNQSVNVSDIEPFIKLTKKDKKAAKAALAAKAAQAEADADAEADDTVPQSDPITWDNWNAEQSSHIRQLLNYSYKNPSEAGKTLAIQIAKLGRRDKWIIAGECSKKLALKVKSIRRYDLLDEFYTAFYYEFNATGIPNEEIRMHVVSEPIALFGTYTVLFTADNMTKIMEVIDEKFDILSIGKYTNNDKEEMMRICAIKKEKGFLAELADNVSSAKGKIYDITQDPRSVFHYVNKTGFN
jgi:hypothetical protein